MVQKVNPVQKAPLAHPANKGFRVPRATGVTGVQTGHRVPRATGATGVQMGHRVPRATGVQMGHRVPRATGLTGVQLGHRVPRATGVTGVQMGHRVPRATGVTGVQMGHRVPRATRATGVIPGPGPARIQCSKQSNSINQSLMGLMTDPGLLVIMSQMITLTGYQNIGDRLPSMAGMAFKVSSKMIYFGKQQ